MSTLSDLVKKHGIPSHANIEWLHLLTAQVDWHAGNVAFVPDPHDPGSERLVLFDNDLAFGHCMLHPGSEFWSGARYVPRRPLLDA